MNLTQTPIAGVVVIETQSFKDARGEFTRLYCEEELSAILKGRRIAQINRSLTFARGAVRGMHYQRAPHAEVKFVRCLRGKVWDVAVDLRKGSPTFLKWHAEELSPGSARTMVIPEGCAHGFQVLEPDSELLYLHTAPYHPESEGGVGYNDPALAIGWPLPPQAISARDSAYPAIDKHFKGLDS